MSDCGLAMKTLLLLVSLLCLLTVQVLAQSGGDYFVYAGTYTNPTPKTTSASKGIYAWRFDSKTGALSPIGLVAETVNPAHVWASPDGRFLYAVNWSVGGRRRRYGERVCDRSQHRRAEVPQQGRARTASRRTRSCSIPAGKIAATVTYNGGTFSAFGVEPDGKLTEAIYTEKHAGQPLSAEAARSARPRRRVLEGQPVGLCRAARPRSRLQLPRSIP